MSGGRLVVLDRLGREVKVFSLEEGLATIGSDPVCDIRVMLPTVSPHHATVVVHTNQTLVRSVSAGETLVNGVAVSVAALRHGDELTVGGRILRWEYNEPNRPRPLAPQPALVRRTVSGAKSRARPRRATQPAGGAVLVPAQRASMPNSASGKQVAIVQPQRRDTNDQNVVRRVAAPASPPAAPRRSTLSRSKSQQPLRLAVLRGAVNLTKIQAPAKIDHTKQAAIMLMTGHTHKGKPQSPRRATFVTKKPSPVRRSPKPPTGSRKDSRSLLSTPRRTSGYSSRNTSKANRTTSILEITDSDTPATTTRRSGRNTTIKSPIRQSPKKSSLKDPAKKPHRKTESIKFDLSNLQGDASHEEVSEDDLTLHYSDASAQSPSPRKSIHSRSSKILEKSIGTTFTHSLVSEESTPTSESPQGRRSLRGCLIVQKALENTDSESSRYSRRSTKTPSEQSFNTVTSARKTRTLSPRSSRNLESYSIVDLVSIDSNESASSLYNSVDSNSASMKFETPQASGRKTRSRALAGPSTPYESNAASPQGSRREEAGVTEAGDARARTPVLCIQRLLGHCESARRAKRKTLPTTESKSKKLKLSVKSRSLDLTSRRSQRARRSSPPSDANQASQDEEVVTPKSAVKLVQEGVKNKHSTAKKPTSKRSIIDDLNESDLVKQLFNSPVKRKLSRSMTEFSRKQLFEDDEVAPFKHTRNTTALTGRTPDNSLLNDTEAFSPEVFVSPLNSPGNSPNLSGIRRLFRKDTPENDLRNMRGVKALLRTPRKRKSVRNDLTNVSGVKKIFGKSPRNRLSDVRIKEVFAASPNNDLTQVWGLMSMFETGKKGKTPKNTLEDVRGVKNLFRSSPRNDLRNVSGVKQVLRVNSPRNDLTDVRGVKNLYGEHEDRNNLSDVSGVEELFYEPSNLDGTFDLLVGKPRVRSYTKGNSFDRIPKPARPARNATSLHESIGPITDNVEEWLESELKKRTYNNPSSSTHTLPLKKRSLANAGADASRLPLKKRRVLHSTPMKGGAADDTIGTRELGRVSPIHAPEPAARPSARKQRASKVVKKKPPALTPKLSPKVERQVTTELKKSPIIKPTQRTRRARPEVTTPGTTRAKKVSLVISKPSPQLKPRSTRSTKRVVPIEIKEIKTRRKITKNTSSDKNVEKTESAPERGGRSKRGRKTKVMNEVTKDQAVQRPMKRSRRNVTADETKEAEVGNKGGKTRARTKTQNSVDATDDKPTNKRAKKNPESDTKDKENKAPNKRSRTTQEKNVEESVETKKITTRGRVVKSNSVTENKKNSVKDNAKLTEDKGVGEVGPRRRRGAKADGDSGADQQAEGSGRAKRGAKRGDEEANEGRKTRNGMKKAEVKTTKTTGRKVPVVEEKVATEQKGRKRKTANVKPPAKVAIVEEKKRRTTRAVTQTETVQRTANRSRRR